MTEQTPSPKRRKLRTATQTMRERALASTAKTEKASHKQPRKLRARIGAFFVRTGRLAVWKPFKFIGRIIFPRYLRASWRELRQVTWPNHKETRQLTGAVILFSLVFGAVVAAFDYGLDKLFKQVIIK